MKPLILTDSQRSVLDVIWRYGPIARVDIGPHTHLSMMSVTRIVKDLSDLGFLVEDVRRTGSRGQPARPLVIKADAAYACGVYFSTSSMRLGIVDLGGTLITEVEAPLASRDPGSVAQTANRLIHRMIADAGIKPELMVGVGFALPGDFVFDRSRLVAHPLFPEFGSGDLQSVLGAQLDFPVFVENDSASAALGERLMGIGQTISNFFFVHIGHGIGGGLVLNGKLYRGANGNSGLIGVQFPNDRPRPSGQDLLETLRAEGVDIEDFRDLDDLRPQTCAPLKRWIGRASDQLRHSLWITARFLDPEAIIIGGRLPAHLIQEIVARIDDDSFCNEGVLLPRPKLFASSLGPAAGMIGAASVPIHNCFFSA
ncbi:ROK family transcriptional regulator [Hyphomonadaceae bacterium BL14]|nr:ROK family transcriptional regulator [Hyphomonadaceae bacterium BL14]